MKRAKITVCGLLILFCWSFSANAGEPVLDANDINPIKPGQKIPDIVLKDIDGQDFSLNKALKKKPVVVIVYRGSWCPYCNTHLGEIAKIEPDLLKLGYQVIAISPDLPKYLKETVEKNELKYNLYSDSQASAVSALGLVFKVDDKTVKKYKKYDIDLERNSGEKHGLLPVPAALVIDRKGIVRFAFAAPNFKQRVDTDLLLSAAKAYK